MFPKAALYLSAVSAVVLMPGVLLGQTVSASPSSLSFGDQKINSRSVQTTNIELPTALERLPFGINITITGTDAADFAYSLSCPNLGIACRLFIIFTPRLPGAKAASVDFSYDYGNVTVPALSIPVTGNAVLTGSFEIVSSLTAKVLDIAANSASDGTPIEQNSLDGHAQQTWRFIPVDGDYCEIVNAITGKVLDVTDQSTEDGARIQEYDYWGGANQQWLLVPIDDIHFEIMNRLSGKVLDVTNGSALNGTPIQQWDFVGNPQQLWVLLPTESYNIGSFSTSGNKVLDVTNGSGSNGALIQQWSSDGYEQQQWQFLPVGGGYYAILNRLTGKVLDDTNDSTSNGTLIQQWDYLGSQNQHWQISPALQISDGNAEVGFKILNELSGKVLDVRNRSTLDGAAIQQWDDLFGNNQQWFITPLVSYNIANVFSSLELDVSGGSTANGTFIQQWPANGNLQQQWQVIPAGNTGYDVIVNILSGKALEVAGSSIANGARVDQSDLAGTDNQLWQLTSHSGPDGSLYWEIVNKHSGKALDDTDFSTAGGTLLQQWDYLGATNQQWQLVPVSN